MLAVTDSRVFAKQKPKAQKWQGLRSYCQEFSRSASMDAGCYGFPGFCEAKTQSPKIAWMLFMDSARDRSGNTFGGANSGAKRLERIARSPARAAQAARAGDAPKY
jgi:hypothetical protein